MKKGKKKNNKMKMNKKRKKGSWVYNRGKKEFVN